MPQSSLRKVLEIAASVNGEKQSYQCSTLESIKGYPLEYYVEVHFFPCISHHRDLSVECKFGWSWITDFCPKRWSVLCMARLCQAHLGLPVVWYRMSCPWLASGYEQPQSHTSTSVKLHDLCSQLRAPWCTHSCCLKTSFLKCTFAFY